MYVYVRAFGNIGVCNYINIGMYIYIYVYDTVHASS